MTLPFPEDFTTRAADIKVIIAVPARLGSTRLPRKPLAVLAGEPLILHVARKVLECSEQLSLKLNIDRRAILTLVATDSTEIRDTVQKTGLWTVMTNSELPSGTDRVEAALQHLETQGFTFSESALVINLQGDEPFFCIEDVVRLAQTMSNVADTPMGTLAYAQNSSEHFLRTSVVKVTRDSSKHALYFSRAPIPWPRQDWGASEPITAISSALNEPREIPFLQHVGIYAFRRAALKKFTLMPPSTLELCEGLEQLRALEAGWKIIVTDALDAPFGIDTAADLQRAEKHCANLGRVK